MTNAAAPGSYYAHLVGPTVNDPAFQTSFGFPGVYLSAFNLNALGTYTYEYQEPTNSWFNIYSVTDPVRATKGLLESTTDNTNYTMSMTGELNTGTILSGNLQHGTNNLDLLSNPFASALDFNVFHAANSTAINNLYRVYDPATGSYLFYQIGGGGTLTKDIQVGQGFFVETLSTSPATFNNSMRVHSTAAFLKDSYANQLRLDAEGENGFKDATFIYLSEGTFNYDESLDVTKWWSIVGDEATDLWTVSHDQVFLSMNTLPALGPEMVTVPMSFSCGEEGTYAITATQIESFEGGTEIWLEDLVTGAPWHDLVMDPVYQFNFTADDPEARFLIHFFGPTGIDEPGTESPIYIYSYDHDAYIVNRGNEVIEEYVVYDMMGRELQRGTLPNATVNKVFIGQVSGYYVVKVVTNNRIYSEKVLINR